MFALVDCNNFYASCERVFRPDLNGKPVVVLSNNDGCVIARSNEAKEMGIKMGAAAFEMKDVFNNGTVNAFSSNYPLYGSLSARVHNIIRQFVYDVEVYSIDEVFLDLKHYSYHNLEKLATQIRNTIKQWTGIPVSIGIAPTKTLAKVANKLAKKQPTGVFTLTNPDSISEVLSKTDTGDLWGIAGAYKTKLAAIGVTTALQLRELPDGWLRKHMTVVGLRMAYELKGISCLPLEMVVPAKKGIMSAKSFGKDALSYEEVSRALACHAHRAAEKLRKQDCSATNVTIFVSSNQFKTNLPQYSNSFTVTMKQANSSSLTLVKYALWALRRIYKDGYNYKKCGVMVTGIVPDNEVQSSLFHKIEPQKSKKASILIDQLNARFGAHSIRLAALGTDKHFWKPVQQRLSGRYTTQWAEILRVRV